MYTCLLVLHALLLNTSKSESLSGRAKLRHERKQISVLQSSKDKGQQNEGHQKWGALKALALPWSSNQGQHTGQEQASAPRMSPTLSRMPLASDIEVWANRPRKAPTFQELYHQVYAEEFSEQQNIFQSFQNPYKMVPHMNYPHSSMWLEGNKVMDRVFQELGESGIKFIVEAGSMHGGSAIRMAMELDKRGLKDVPILCVDPWTGDLNMWLNRVVWEHLNVRDGRATTYDQFMVNVREAINTGKISPHHITPFPVTSIIGARWLQATGFTPQLIYLDSAHEVDETYYELSLYFNILQPGGILMGDDYGWQAVHTDVDRFVKDKNLTLNMFGVYYNWFVKKAA